jgi:hypothetical protein
MSSQEFLYYSLGIGFLVLVGYLCYLLYHLTQAVKTLKLVIEDAEDITKDISKIKNSIKLGLFSLLSSFIKKKH